MKLIKTTLACYIALLGLIGCASQTKKNDSSGLFPVMQNGKYGFIDTAGKLVINPQFDLAHRFSEGLACVCVGNGCSGNGSERKYGFVGKTGQYVINPQFDFADDFSEGLALVTISGKKGFIDTGGKIIINPQYDVAEAFSDGLANVEGFKYLDKTGKIVINIQSKHLRGEKFSDGLAAVYAIDDSKWGYIDKTGRVVIQPQFSGSVGGGSDAGEFSEGLARVSVAGKRGYINKSGQIVINPQFEYADDFSEGLACVSSDGKRFGFIDKTGNYVISPQFDSAGDYSGAARLLYQHRSTIDFDQWSLNPPIKQKIHSNSGTLVSCVLR
jgi:hypothetical protein